jgi:hypothetical protein
MIGGKILIGLALCRLVSNDIGSENHHDKLGEKRQDICKSYTQYNGVYVNFCLDGLNIGSGYYANGNASASFVQYPQNYPNW